MVVSLLENFTGSFFQSVFFLWFFNRDLLRRPIFLFISFTHTSDRKNGRGPKSLHKESWVRLIFLCFDVPNPLEYTIIFCLSSTYTQIRNITNPKSLRTIHHDVVDEILKVIFQYIHILTSRI